MGVGNHGRTEPPLNMPEPATILVVDDEADLRKALLFDFKRLGYSVLEAGSGREAYGIITSRKIDLVLSDIRMPDGDGVELLRAIQKLERDRPLAILFTGFTDLSLEDPYDLGALAIFPKPFDRKSLISAVQSALARTPWEGDGKGIGDFDLELSFDSFESAVSRALLNFGSGGLYVWAETPPFRVGDAVRLRFTFRSGEPAAFSIRGLVRWTRTSRSERGEPGFGLEILETDAATRTALLARIAESGPRAFIPRGPRP